MTNLLSNSNMIAPYMRPKVISLHGYIANIQNPTGTSIDIKSVLHSCSNAPIEVD